MTSDTLSSPTRTGSRGRRSANTSVGLATARPTAKRLDLQGLRALAVGLVVLNHAFDWPAGGFVGVDIFFVISGFLMTSLLYREYERTGTIAFLAFYRRRIRRLIPASATVIAVTLAGAFALLGSGRFLSTVWDGAAALFFVSNWRFAASQTDYFAQGAQTSPLQHYWSLNLEEQYYVVWPIAVLVLGLLVARQQRPRATAAVQCLVITVGLFLVSLQLTQTDSGSAYFITPARLWELWVGSTIALCMPLFDRLPARWRPAIMLFSFAGMLTASVITPSGTGFPAPWALVAVISTAVFIAFPWQPRRTLLNPLANPVMTHVGDISYSLYLWHFPVLILITEAFRGLPGEKTAIPAVVSIAVALGLSELSYRYIEETVRKSRWLEPKRKRSHGSAYKRVVLGTLATVVGATLAFAFMVDRRAGSPEALTEKAAPQTRAPIDVGTSESAVDAISAELKSALAATSWPELDPSMDTVTSTYVGNAEANACAGWNYPGVKACTWGSAAPTRKVAIVGDSTSSKYVPMLRGLSEAPGGAFSVTSFAANNCPFVDIETETADRQSVQACTARKELALTDIATLKPDVLIITNSYLPPHQASDQATVTFREHAQGVQRYIEKLTPDVGRFVLLAPPPADKDVRECLSPRTGPRDCVSTVTSDWKGMAAGDEKLVGDSVVWIDSRALFCEKSKCPAFADGIPIKFDRTHLTEEYARHIAPAFLALLTEKDVSLTGT